MSPTEPLDHTHQASMAAVQQIRQRVMEIRSQINKWEPAPMPKEFK